MGAVIESSWIQLIIYRDCKWRTFSAGMECGIRFNQHDRTFIFGDRFVSHPFGNNAKLPCIQDNGAIFELNAKRAIDY